MTPILHLSRIPIAGDTPGYTAVHSYDEKPWRSCVLKQSAKPSLPTLRRSCICTSVLEIDSLPPGNEHLLGRRTTGSGCDWTISGFVRGGTVPDIVRTRTASTLSRS